ncbi:TspO/MBR family domain protein [Candidatus Megaera venefica]|uniref:TspO/MBR family domain protein n=1 Tax=Candidatus Megaera venefica TaxID=2055910 RepID=A0ABU5NDI9_9RICK|nr:TspO/MBR family domain protein [Candidatus Megaera venefica]
MYPWYGQLIKSSLTPPGYYFGIIWPILYISLAILGWETTQRKGENYTKVVLDWDVFKLVMEPGIFYLSLKRVSTLDINFTCHY